MINKGLLNIINNQERFIGYWFGQKLYEKIIVTKTASSTNSLISIANIPNVLHYVDVKGSWSPNSVYWTESDGYGLMNENLPNRVILLGADDSGNIYNQCGANSINKDLIIFAHYIKNN